MKAAHKSAGFSSEPRNSYKSSEPSTPLTEPPTCRRGGFTSRPAPAPHPGTVCGLGFGFGFGAPPHAAWSRAGAPRGLDFLLRLLRRFCADESFLKDKPYDRLEHGKVPVIGRESSKELGKKGEREEEVDASSNSFLQRKMEFRSQKNGKGMVKTEGMDGMGKSNRCWEMGTDFALSKTRFCSSVPSRRGPVPGEQRRALGRPVPALLSLAQVKRLFRTN